MRSGERQRARAPSRLATFWWKASGLPTTLRYMVWAEIVPMTITADKNAKDIRNCARVKVAVEGTRIPQAMTPRAKADAS